MQDRRIFYSLLPPLVAAGLQWLLWPWLAPYVWFCFFPAVFFSSRIAGRMGAAFSAVTSAMLVWGLFLDFSTKHWVPVGLFMLAGMVVGEIEERLIRANWLVENKLLSVGRASEEVRTQLVAIVESSEDAIISKNLDGMITSWNRGAEKIFGYSAAEALGRPISLLFPTELLKEEQMIQARIAKGRSVPRFDTVRLHKDGYRIDISETVSPIFDQQGKAVGAAKIARDVGDRKRLEDALAAYQQSLEVQVTKRTEELRQQTRYLQALIDNIPGMVWLKNTDGIYLAANQAITRLFNSAVVGHSDQDIWPKDALRYQAEDREVMRTRQQTKTVAQISGMSAKHFEIFKTAVVDEDETVLGTVGFARDISAQLQLDEAREEARAAAEHLATVKSEFLANMSHEIRTPLNGMLGLARIGLRDSADVMSREIFGRIQESGTLLLGITNDVLDFTKIEAGKLNVETIPTDLQRVIQHASEVVEQRAESKGIAFVVETSPRLPRVCKSDPLRLEQILINLLSNAIKFTEAGSVHLYADCIDGELIFRVVDTGIGMSAEQIRFLFTAFQQADSTTTRRFGGTGLGLAITKRLIDMMQGEIKVASRFGEGSSFEVHLPYAATSEPVRSEMPLVLVPGESQLQGVSVLVAEDNEVNQLVIEDMLLSAGAEVEMVANGRQAVMRVRKNSPDRYDVVLMDLQMPEMDGYEATRLIHQLVPQLPVIAQSAHAMNEEREKCLAQGMADYVVKPIDANRLYAAVIKWIRPSNERPLRAKTKPAKASAPIPESIPPQLMDPAVIDLTVLARRFPGDAAKVSKFAAKFAETTAQSLEDMDHALRRQDLLALKSQGHKIKSAARTVGAMHFADLCQELEGHCLRGASMEAEKQVHELHVLFAMISARLHDESILQCHE